MILLQHGLLDSAHTFAINGPKQSLAFILADNGYDVWLANSRGSTYSSKHVFLNPDESAYWNFSWDEMARYDLPAFVGQALKVSNVSRLTYVGHSQVRLARYIYTSGFSSDVGAIWDIVIRNNCRVATCIVGVW